MPGRRLTSTTELLKQCNYLSVQQMVHYHSVALVHKVLVHQAPVHLYHIVSRALASGVRHLYDTRAACRRDVAPARLAWHAMCQQCAISNRVRHTWVAGERFDVCLCAGGRA